MASSLSVTPPSPKHQIFISFRREDTRDGFFNDLYHALLGKRITFFIDLDLYRGDDLSLVIHKRLEESKISVVVFSKRYAASVWCLNELVHILECKKLYAQVVIPVFYNINPSDVRKQKGTLADTFKELQNRYEESLVERWRSALTEVASISGYDSQVIKPESLLIEKLVEYIWEKLPRPPPSPPWLGDNEFVDKIFMNKDLVTEQSINIKDLFDGDEYGKAIPEVDPSIRKINIERTFVAINFVLEVLSAVIDDLSSKYKPQYALVSMLMSFITMVICITELVYKGRERRVVWRWREKIPWFYYPSPSPRLFGTVTDFIGLLCGIFQSMFTTADYIFYLQNSDIPFKISTWPLVFAFCLLCSQLSKNPLIRRCFNRGLLKEY